MIIKGIRLTRRKGSGMLGMAIMLCLIVTFSGLYTTKIIAQSFNAITNQSIGKQAESYAESRAELVRLTPYENLQQIKRQNIAGSKFDEDVDVHDEYCDPRGVYKRNVIVNVYSKGDTIPCFTLVVPKVNLSTSKLNRGLVLLWAGEKNRVPNGFTICDGTKGTPDLRNYFLVGAGGNYKAAETGGKEKVQLTIPSMASHTHSGTGTTSIAGNHSHRVMEYMGMPGINGSWNNSHLYSLVSGQSNWWTGLAGQHSHSISGTVTGISSVGKNAAHENRPLYYGIYYIMKV